MKVIKRPTELEATQWFKIGDCPELEKVPWFLPFLLPGVWVLSNTETYSIVKPDIFKRDYQEVNSNTIVPIDRKGCICFYRKDNN
jgi:hypothetical protein